MAQEQQREMLFQRGKGFTAQGFPAFVRKGGFKHEPAFVRVCSCREGVWNDGFRMRYSDAVKLLEDSAESGHLKRDAYKLVPEHREPVVRPPKPKLEPVERVKVEKPAKPKKSGPILRGSYAAMFDILKDGDWHPVNALRRCVPASCSLKVRLKKFGQLFGVQTNGNQIRLVSTTAKDAKQKVKVTDAPFGE